MQVWEGAGRVEGEREREKESEGVFVANVNAFLLKL